MYTIHIQVGRPFRNEEGKTMKQIITKNRFNGSMQIPPRNKLSSSSFIGARIQVGNPKWQIANQCHE